MVSPTPTVFLVDDDHAVRDALSLLLESADLETEAFETASAFLKAYDPDKPGCLVLDIRMPGMSGMELQEALASKEINIPIIFLTGHGNVPMSAKAFRAGAVDFMQKPFDEDVLLERIEEAIERDQANRAAETRRLNADNRLMSLTPREREVMLRVAAGKSNKEIAAELRLSHRTVEIHRARVMEKSGAESLPDLIELVTASGIGELD